MWDTLILNPMTNLLLLLYQYLFHNFALAVAAFTIVTRLITLPFTVKQQRSAKAMQLLQPELEKLKRKYGKDKEKSHDPPLLFHLGHDPSEKHDVSKDHPEVINDIQKEVALHLADLTPGEDQLAKRIEKN